MSSAIARDMLGELEETLAKVPVIPVLVIEDAESAVPVARALADGGLPIAEVTLRTDAATDAIAAIAEHAPDVLVGAGTVLDGGQVDIAKAAGARFVVSPGLSESVVTACEMGGIPCIPGVMTASEVQRAWNLGISTLKFFPAVQAGGTATIKALASAFRAVKFVPTGGITADNLGDYLALPSVVACGGSWLAPATTVAAGDFAAITRRAEAALAVATGSGG